MRQPILLRLREARHQRGLLVGLVAADLHVLRLVRAEPTLAAHLPDVPTVQVQPARQHAAPWQPPPREGILRARRQPVVVQRPRRLHDDAVAVHPDRVPNGPAHVRQVVPHLQLAGAARARRRPELRLELGRKQHRLQHRHLVPRHPRQVRHAHPAHLREIRQVRGDGLVDGQRGVERELLRRVLIEQQERVVHALESHRGRILRRPLVVPLVHPPTEP